MSALIIEAMFDDSKQNLNMLPRKTGVSKHLSHLAIFTYVTKLDCTKLNLSFGDHAEAHEENIHQSNSAKTRGALAITLDQVHNSYGTCYFYSLVSGCRLKRFQ